jgi:ABC-type transport system involved in multi-copper enzyme maturation permease subunit
MNGALLRHIWRSQRAKLAIVSIALTVWGFLLPLVYARFGSQFTTLMESGILPDQFARFGGGDVFSLSGSIALGFIHPIAIILTSVFAVGFSASAVAGERQRGTLEVALARPISRRVLYFSLLVASLGFIAITIAALLAGSVGGATFAGVVEELPFRRLPLLWLNSVLLFGAFAAIGLAASVSFDRLTPAVGVTLAIGIGMYVLEVLGSLWPAAEVLQPYSLFHYLQAKAILTGVVAAVDLAVLSSVILAAMVWALVVFPRRDLAAPSG